MSDADAWEACPFCGGMVTCRTSCPKQETPREETEMTSEGWEVEVARKFYTSFTATLKGKTLTIKKASGDVPWAASLPQEMTKNVRGPWEASDVCKALQHLCDVWARTGEPMSSPDI